MSVAEPFREDRGRLLLALKVTPKASANRVGKCEECGPANDGFSHRLKLQVTAPPEDGAANKAVIKLLAAALCIPKVSLSLTSGATSRYKVVAIEPLDLSAMMAKIRTISTTTDTH